MEQILKLFNATYTEKELNVFTNSLDRKFQLRKKQLNFDTCVYITKVSSLNSFCVIYEHFDSVLFKNYADLIEANFLFDSIISAYGD